MSFSLTPNLLLILSSIFSLSVIIFFSYDFFYIYFRFFFWNLSIFFPIPFLKKKTISGFVSFTIYQVSSVLLGLFLLFFLKIWFLSLQSVCAQWLWWEVCIWSEHEPHVPSGWSCRDDSQRRYKQGLFLFAGVVTTLSGQERCLRGCSRSLGELHFSWVWWQCLCWGLRVILDAPSSLYGPPFYEIQYQHLLILKPNLKYLCFL